MVKKAEQMRRELKERMRGGDGAVELVHILEDGEYKGKARLLAKIILRPAAPSARTSMRARRKSFIFSAARPALWMEKPRKNCCPETRR